MNKLVTYDSSWQPIAEVELGEEISVQLDFSLSDFRKAGNRKGNKSKSFTVPGTDANNRYFGGLYDVNATYEIFNPNVKVNAVLTVDNQELMRGFMKLDKITLDDMGYVNWHLVLFDTSVGFWDKISGKTLLGNPLTQEEVAAGTDPDNSEDNIDFSELNHIWNKPNMEASWTGAWDTTGYYYPFLNGHTPTSVLFSNATSSYFVEAQNMRPAIYHKRLLDMIITQAGYTWSGSLKDDPIYEREIIPYTGELANAGTKAMVVGEGNEFYGYRPDPQWVYSTGVIGDNTFPLSAAPIAMEFDDETSLYQQKQYKDPDSLWDGVDRFTADAAGLHTFSFDFAVNAILEYTKSGNVSGGALYHKADIYLEVEKNPAVGITEYYYPGLGQANIYIPMSSSDPNGAGLIAGDEVAGGFTVLDNSNNAEIYLDIGDQVIFRFRLRASVFTRSNGNGYFGGDITMDDYKLEFKKPTSINLTSFKPSALGSGGSTISYSDNFIKPSIKKIDIIKDVIARYGVYIYADPDDPKHLIFDTGNDFLSNEEVFDWDAKKDENTKSELTLVSELQNEFLNLTYSEAKDEYNEQYTDAYDETFGQYEYRFDNDFVKGVKKIETPFEPTPLTAGFGIHFPSLRWDDDKAGLRVLYAPTTPTPSPIASLYAMQIQFVGNVGIAIYSYPNYPYAGHIDSPYLNPATLDINFGEVQELPNNFNLPPNSVAQTDNNLVNRYWTKYISILENSKKMKAKFELSANDVYRLRKAPNTKIWVDNAYWLVDNLKFEGNDRLRGLTTVELITINIDQIDYTPTVISGGGGGADPGGGSNNRIGNNSSLRAVNIVGHNNIIDSGAENVSITGSNNAVFGNSTNVSIQNSTNVRVTGNNVTVIGSSDLSVVSDNITIIDNVLYKGDQRITLFNMVDGGEDELRSSDSQYSTNLIEGGENTNINTFDSNHNIIDGNAENTNTI